MRNRNSKYIIVGKFGKTHGIDGYLRVISFCEPVDAVMQYDPWYVKQHGEWLRLVIDKLQLRADNAILVKIKDCDTPEEASFYINKEIAVFIADNGLK